MIQITGNNWIRWILATSLGLMTIYRMRVITGYVSHANTKSRRCDLIDANIILICQLPTMRSFFWLSITIHVYKPEGSGAWRARHAMGIELRKVTWSLSYAVVLSTYNTGTRKYCMIHGSEIRPLERLCYISSWCFSSTYRFKTDHSIISHHRSRRTRHQQKRSWCCSFCDGMDHQDYLCLSVTLPEIPIGATCFHTYFNEENRIEIIAQLHDQV